MSNKEDVFSQLARKQRGNYSPILVKRNYAFPIASVLFVLLLAVAGFLYANREIIPDVDKSIPITALEDEDDSIVIEDIYEPFYVVVDSEVFDSPVDGNVIGTVEKDTVINATGETEDGWYRFSLDGEEAYINGNSLVKDTSHSIDGEEFTLDIQPEDVEDGVWVPVHGGTKYHLDAECSDMRDPVYVSVDTAASYGFSACKKCYK